MLLDLILTPIRCIAIAGGWWTRRRQAAAARERAWLDAIAATGHHVHEDDDHITVMRHQR